MQFYKSIRRQLIEPGWLCDPETLSYLLEGTRGQTAWVSIWKVSCVTVTYSTYTFVHNAISYECRFDQIKMNLKNINSNNLRENALEKSKLYIKKSYCSSGYITVSATEVCVSLPGICSHKSLCMCKCSRGNDKTSIQSCISASVSLTHCTCVKAIFNSD